MNPDHFADTQWDDVVAEVASQEPSESSQQYWVSCALVRSGHRAPSRSCRTPGISCERPLRSALVCFIPLFGRSRFLSHSALLLVSPIGHWRQIP